MECIIMSKKYVVLIFIILFIIGLVIWAFQTNKITITSTSTNNLENESTDQNNNDVTDETNDAHHNNEDNENKNHTNNEQITNEEPEPSVLDEADPSIIKLVNKENELGPDDHPDDLVTIDVPYVLDNPEVNQLREEASKALSAMFEEAKEEDVELFARSGFRSYQTQEALFNSYVEQNGIDEANRFSARPGQSEHQTGLVMDVTSEQVDYDLTEEFGNTSDGIWLKENAHRFGFIIRYPEDKEAITGYIYEPWHIRYLSKEVASAVFESGLTYEEFIKEEEGRSDNEK